VDPEHGPPQDRDRCPERHEVGRCQLVRGHDGQHVLRYGSATIGWPDGEEHPTQWLPWAPTFPRDERSRRMAARPPGRDPHDPIRGDDEPPPDQP